MSLRALGRSVIGIPGASNFQTDWVQGWKDKGTIIVLQDHDRGEGGGGSQTLVQDIQQAALEVHGQAWVSLYARSMLQGARTLMTSSCISSLRLGCLTWSFLLDPDPTLYSWLDPHPDLHLDPYP